MNGRPTTSGAIDALPLDAEDFLTHLLIEKGRSPNTLSAYRCDLSKYAAYLADRKVEIRDATHQDIEGFTALLHEAQLAATSTNRTMSAVRGLHRYLFAEGVTTEDPTADVEQNKLPRGLPKALSQDEVTAVLEAPGTESAPDVRDRAILELLYGTGMRISECVGLSLEDIDQPAALIRVTGKGNKQRLVPIGRLAAKALEMWLGPAGRSNLAPDTWAGRDQQMAVFLNQRGGRLSRQGMWGVVRKHGLAAGVADRLTPHVLRHSCATHMLDNGADIRTVQELLGHGSISTTQLYTKVSTDLLVRSYRAAHPRATSKPGKSS